MEKSRVNHVLNLVYVQNVAVSLNERVGKGIQMSSRFEVE
jgi:hypothetical protein